MCVYLIVTNKIFSLKLVSTSNRTKRNTYSKLPFLSIRIVFFTVPNIQQQRISLNLFFYIIIVQYEAYVLLTVICLSVKLYI